MMRHFALLAIAVAGLAAAPAAAITIVRNTTLTAPEYNGDGNDGRVVIADWFFSLLPGETIVAAKFTSNFGNSVVASSSIGTVELARRLVLGRCDGPGEPCWDGPGAPILYNFAVAEFAALIGPIELTYDQTDCCTIRLGPSQLSIRSERIERTIVPEPASWAMLITGFGLVGGLHRLRSRRPTSLAR